MKWLLFFLCLPGVSAIFSQICPSFFVRNSGLKMVFFIPVGSGWVCAVPDEWGCENSTRIVIGMLTIEKVVCARYHDVYHIGYFKHPPTPPPSQGLVCLLTTLLCHWWYLCHIPWSLQPFYHILHFTNEEPEVQEVENAPGGKAGVCSRAIKLRSGFLIKNRVLLSFGFGGLLAYFQHHLDSRGFLKVSDIDVGANAEGTGGQGARLRAGQSWPFIIPTVTNVLWKWQQSLLRAESSMA